MHGMFRYVEFKDKIEFSHLQKHKSPLGVRCPYLSRMEKEGCAFAEGKWSPDLTPLFRRNRESQAHYLAWKVWHDP